jgi:hypothetical protein
LQISNDPTSLKWDDLVKECKISQDGKVEKKATAKERKKK